MTPVSTAAVELLMKRCQTGVGGPGALDRAHDLLAACYGILGALVQERDRLARGECICVRCGRRQPGVSSGGPDF